MRIAEYILADYSANAPPEPEQSSSALPEHAQNTFPFSARLYACSSPVCVKRYVNVLHFARTCIDNALNLQISCLTSEPRSLHRDISEYSKWMRRYLRLTDAF